MSFSLLHTDKNCAARTGRLDLAHASIDTPVFMPVGTQGTVKNIPPDKIYSAGASLILGNTYHLYLRPGQEILKTAGGLHQFSAWQGALLTDSGGYQVFSLSERRKISEEGVLFHSHIDGSRHLFTPESVVQIQKNIGADIIMAFDECIPHDASYTYAQTSTERTHRWFQRCLDAFRRLPATYGYAQHLFPIVQGGMYADLRKLSCDFLAPQPSVGIAIGGLSVGEEKNLMYEMCALCCENLPNHKARYLMGVGTPADLLTCIGYGVDMFDCVMPTRNGRNGLLFTTAGILHIHNAKWKNDHSPIDAHLPNAPASQTFTKAYLRHLFHSGELLASHIASLHNIAFYVHLMQEARKHIQEGDFTTWKESMLPLLNHKL